MRAQWRQVAEQVQSCRGESERGELAPVARRSGLRDETQEGVMARGRARGPQRPDLKAEALALVRLSSRLAPQPPCHSGR